MLLCTPMGGGLVPDLTTGANALRCFTAEIMLAGLYPGNPVEADELPVDMAPPRKPELGNVVGGREGEWEGMAEGRKYRGTEDDVNSVMLVDMGTVSQKILSPLVILSMEKTMVTKVISELKSVSRLKILPETGPWTREV